MVITPFAAGYELVEQRWLLGVRRPLRLRRPRPPGRAQAAPCRAARAVRQPRPGVTHRRRPQDAAAVGAADGGHRSAPPALDHCQSWTRHRHLRLVAADDHRQRRLSERAPFRRRTPAGVYLLPNHPPVDLRQVSLQDSAGVGRRGRRRIRSQFPSVAFQQVGEPPFAGGLRAAANPLPAAGSRIGQPPLARCVPVAQPFAADHRPAARQPPVAATFVHVRVVAPPVLPEHIPETSPRIGVASRLERSSIGDGR